MRVLMAGAGAIGQWLGLALMRGGHDVTLLVRPVHAAAIARDGLLVHGASQMRGHPHCVTGLDHVGTFDAVVVTSKAHQTAALAPVVAPHLAADGVLATVQNGFGNAQKLAASAAPEQIAVAPLSHGVFLERPGRLLHAGGAGAVVGAHVPEGESAARRMHGLLVDAGLDPTWTEDVRGHVWRKGLVNHAVNPVGALHVAPNAGLLHGPAWEQCQALADEGYAIARAAGIRLPDTTGLDGLVASIRGTLERSGRNRNSMLVDLEARRPTELEQISGRLVRLARRLGLGAPNSDEVYRRVKERETAYLGEEAALRRVRDEVAWETTPF